MSIPDGKCAVAMRGSLISLIYIASNQTAFGLELDRTFDQIGNQTLWQTTEWWLDNSYQLPWSSAGFLIEGRGTNITGVIYQHGAAQLEVCPPLGGSGYESTPAPMPYTCPSFSISFGVEGHRSDGQWHRSRRLVSIRLVSANRSSIAALTIKDATSWKSVRSGKQKGS
ncbi:hypothetical protein [Dyella sp.]|uniref:hypothetical protein n=1 Tax=Dyella sp. TaxID=1869338 RepID=UPI002FD994F5